MGNVLQMGLVVSKISERKCTKMSTCKNRNVKEEIYNGQADGDGVMVFCTAISKRSK